VIDSAGPAVVNATNADNAISYTVGANSGTAVVGGATTGQVADGFETFEFANKTTLTINGLGGSDATSINNASTLTVLTGVTVNGGDHRWRHAVAQRRGSHDDDRHVGGTVARHGAGATASPTPQSSTYHQHRREHRRPSPHARVAAHELHLRRASRPTRALAQAVELASTSSASASARY
jgi:hypothetical protein